MLALLLLLAVAPAPQFTVCGVDRSGSTFSLVEAGLRVCAEIIARAQPGDEVVIRWISDVSFRATEQVLRVRVPEASRACANPLNARCRAAEDASATRILAVKREAVRQLMTMRTRPAPRTDIAGFLQAASDLLATAPVGATRTLVLATDLEDTLGQSTELGLGGVQVVVVAMQVSGNLSRALLMRRRWRESLTAAGAAGVEFRSVEVPR